MQILSRQARQAVFQIYVPSLIMALGIGMIVPAVPLLGRTFGVSMGLSAQVVTAQVLGRAVAMGISATVRETHACEDVSRREIFNFGRLNQVELYFRET